MLFRSEAYKAVKNGLGSAWNRTLGKIRNGASFAAAGLQRVSVATKVIKGVANFTWQCRRSCFAALCVGVLCGVGVYHAGPVIASVACGLGGSLATVAGIALAPVWRFMVGSDDD